MLSHSCAAPLSSCPGNYNTSGKEAASTCWVETTPLDCSAGVLLVLDAGSLRAPQHSTPHWHSPRCYATKLGPYPLAKANFSSSLMVAVMFNTLLMIALCPLFHIHLQHPGLMSLLPTPCPNPASAPSPSLGLQEAAIKSYPGTYSSYFKNTHIYMYCFYF